MLNDILLPFIVKNYNPEKVYQFPHPPFEGSGYKAYRTLLIVPSVCSNERFYDLNASMEKLDLEGYGYVFCFQKQTALVELMETGHLFYSTIKRLSDQYIRS